MGDNEAAIINVHEFMAVVKQRDGMPRDKKGIIAVMLKSANTVGGVRRDIYEYLRDKTVAGEKTLLCILELLNNMADLAWFELVIDCDKNRRPSEVFAVEIINAYRDGIAAEVVKNYYSEAKYPFELAVARARLRKDERDINEIVCLMSRVMEDIYAREKEYDAHYETLKQQVETEVEETARYKEEVERLQATLAAKEAECAEMEELLTAAKAAEAEAEMRDERSPDMNHVAEEHLIWLKEEVLQLRGDIAALLRSAPEARVEPEPKVEPEVSFRPESQARVEPEPRIIPELHIKNRSRSQSRLALIFLKIRKAKRYKDYQRKDNKGKLQELFLMMRSREYNKNMILYIKEMVGNGVTLDAVYGVIDSGATEAELETMVVSSRIMLSDLPPEELAAEQKAEYVHVPLGVGKEVFVNA